ncbi:SDR family NAD(P)-dependent oxidoreductase [Pseudonocardiaceae bacterium YIM PH 21723]|nr:SDR family NAD(P)-dependent oxidoreductase [Pseudonocardiaceae bacterium YIM PH 21723]
MTEIESDRSVAIIGMSCRTAGAENMDMFWQLLCSGKDAIRPAPDDRWYDVPELARYRRGGFVDGVDRFDAGFFDISPREARTMDPRQRMALELTWEAIEDSATSTDRLHRESTAVYFGASGDDYMSLAHRRGSDVISHDAVTGLNRGLIANRVSHKFGFGGASMTVDTAQSSSLVAVHMAAEAVRSGAARMAVAGGFHVNLVPESTIAFARAGALSPDGLCYTFDSRANGFVRGEGGAVVLLKRLREAIADHDPIYAVILGGATNHDGDSAALTVPAGDAQRSLLRAACIDASVEPTDVQYVELHGSGTKTGDPVEAAALGEVFGHERMPDDPLLVGSVKTNVGHLEAAAGVVGLVKVALAIHHRRIPASLHFERPNPAISLARSRLRVVQEDRAWPGGGPRLAGVSSFGIGGANCHVVLATPPAARESRPVHIRDRAPVVIHARSAVALRGQAARLRDWVVRHPELTPVDVGHSALHTRSAMRHRAVLVAADREELVAGLSAVAAGEPHPDVISGKTHDSAKGPVAWVFPGQGAQWVGMGLGLWRDSPAFAESMERCQRHLDGLVSWSLRGVLADEALLSRVDVIQPTLFAVMVSLAEVWRAAGVRPDAVVGHSQGEIAAAVVAGVMSLADGISLIVQRSAVASRLSGQGLMASIAMPASEVPVRGDVVVAAVNGPNSVVVSGSEDAVRALVDDCAARGIRTRIIPTFFASHSPLVEKIKDEVISAAASVNHVNSETAFYSTVTGGRVQGANLDAGYWYRNLRQSVCFSGAIEAMVADGYATFVEISPHPGLTGAIKDISAGVSVIGTLRRNEDDVRRMLLSQAELYLCGTEVDLASYVVEGRRIALPTYAFDRQSYWLPAGGPAVTAGAPALDVSARSTPQSGPIGESESVDLDRLLRSHAAAVLGHGDLSAIEFDATFKELGFDSVTAVELRDRLNAAMDLALPTSALFDYPTPQSLIAHLRGRSSDPRITQDTDGMIDGDPVVVVGMACRLPGEVSSPEELWQLIDDSRDAIGAFPEDRGWQRDPAQDYPNRGGFISGIGEFDAGFFRISPREARAMDPQQRLALEVSWEALERSGHDAIALRGSSTGVFFGAMAQDYLPRLAEIPESQRGYGLTGGSSSVISGRVAYSFGFQGPALTVDTACSSSLVALHLAARSLRAGECGLALAGGVTVMATPGLFIEFARQGGLAADGRCKSFADSADGTGWSEGAGVLVLQRLSDARREGRRVLAVLRGSAINQDGESNGLTAPNGPSQQRVIRAALADAGLAPADVDVLEAHGTGTTLGDPIEAQAVLATYGQNRTEPAWLGSVKSNIGHTQAAAGVTGVIKVVMAMRHGRVPQTLHADNPSRQVDWSSGSVRLATRSLPWPQVDRPRRAAVSSFGISGTNAHMIVEQGDPVDTSARSSVRSTGVIPFVVSARSPASLASQARRLRDTITPADDLSDIAGTLIGRSAFHHRAVLFGEERDELMGGLTALADGQRAGNLVVGAAATEHALGFLFSGQGSQRPGMGRGLAEAFPVFAHTWDAVCRELDPLLPQPITDVVGAAAGSSAAELLDQTRFTQPAIFAFEVSAFALLRSLGLAPAVLLGHSIGELAAAHVAGVFSLADAAKLVAARSRLMQELPEGGAMLAVRAPVGEVRDMIDRHAPPVGIAAINGPEAVVISGAHEQVEVLRSLFADRGFTTKRLRVSHAFHSPLMEPMIEGFSKVAETISYSSPNIPLVSNMTGKVVDPVVMCTGRYWTDQVLATVLFAEGVHAAVDAGARAFVEVGPTGVLCGAVRDVLGDGSQIPTVPLARADRAEGRAALAALAELHTAGVTVDWRAYLAESRIAGRHIDLPTYAFDRQRYWVSAQPVSAAKPGETVHPLLSRVTTSAADGRVLIDGRCSLDDLPWLVEHSILGVPMLPGTAIVEMALRAAKTVGLHNVAELVLRAPLPVDGDAVALQIVIDPDDETRRRPISLYARAAAQDSWVLLATGLLDDAPVPTDEPGAVWPPEAATEVDVPAYYEALAERGYGYGPAFRGLTAMWRTEDTVYAEVELADHVSGQTFDVHPALFDAALHPALSLLLDESETVMVPFSWDTVSMSGRAPRSLRVRARRVGPGEVTVQLFDTDGRFALSAGSLGVAAASREQLSAKAPDSLYDVRWRVLDTGGHAVSATAEVVRIDPGADAARTVAARRACSKALGHVRRWLDESSTGPMILLTSNGVAVTESDVVDPAAAAVWGLMRSVQAEHPGRFAVVDVPDMTGTPDIPAGIDVGAEPQLAIRAGRAYVPRLAAATDDRDPDGGRLDWSRGTVLLTGASGALGELVARHAVKRLGARHLVLLSRSGGGTPSAEALDAEMRAFGTSVSRVACDVSDRTALAGVLAAVDPEHPLRVVVHAAGVLDDGLVESLSDERIDRVFAPKVDGAWHLHELTRHLPLLAFVLFSSVTGTVNTVGQANYAAANSFLDALADYRRSAGLVASSLAWGPWAVGMAGELSDAHRAGLLRRQGMVPIEPAAGLALFDAALTVNRPVVLPVAFDRADFGAAGDSVVLRGLRTESSAFAGTSAAGPGDHDPDLHSPVTRSDVPEPSLAAKIAQLPEDEQVPELLSLLLSISAVVLDHPSPDSVDPEMSLQEMGFDSLSWMEFRNRIRQDAGVSIPIAVIQQYPTPAVLAARLRDLMFTDDGSEVAQQR